MMKNSCRVVILSEAWDLLCDELTTNQILRRSPRRPPQNDIAEGIFINVVVAQLLARSERLSETRGDLFSPTELARYLGGRSTAQGGLPRHRFFRGARDGSEPRIPGGNESPRVGARERAKILLAARTVPDELPNLLVGFSKWY